MALRKRIGRARYETSQAELTKAAYDGPFGRNAEDFSSVFCSELVAEAYQTMGLVRDERTKAANEYTPADLSEKGEKIHWIGGKLSPEIRIGSELRSCRRREVT